MLGIVNSQKKLDLRKKKGERDMDLGKIGRIANLAIKNAVAVYGRNTPFVIAPFDEGGKIVRSALNVGYGITEAALMDSESGEGIAPLSMLEKQEYRDAVVLLASCDIEKHQLVLEELERRFYKDRIVDVFAEYLSEEKDIALREIKDQRLRNERIRRMLQRMETDSSLSGAFCYHPKRTQASFFLPFVFTDLIQGTIFDTDDYYEAEELHEIFYGTEAGRIARRCEGGCFVDAGANIGNHTVFYALEMKASKVFSFEPIPETFEILSRNIALNHLDQIVTAFACCVSNAQSTAGFKAFDLTNIGATRLFESNEGDIPMITLDQVLGEQQVDFLKVDVEGMEVQAILGARRLIQRDKPVIHVESWDEISVVRSMLMEWNPQYQIKQMKNCNYLFY